MTKPESETLSPDEEALAAAATRIAERAAEECFHLNAVIRDALMSHIHTLKSPWPKLSEKDQQNVLEAVEKTAREVIRVATATVAVTGFDHVAIRLKDFQVKDGHIKGKFEATMGENVQLLADHEGTAATIVLANPETWMQGAWPQAEPDQPEMPLEGSAETDEEQDDDQRRAPRRARR